MTTVAPRAGMRAFYAIWTGQSLSTLGSELTGFALGVWVFERTGSVTQLALIVLATLLPGILLTPWPAPGSIAWTAGLPCWRATPWPRSRPW